MDWRYRKGLPDLGNGVSAYAAWGDAERIVANVASLRRQFRAGPRHGR